ncbi:MAG: alpha-amylase [Lachnospiraceae bacterium]|nr:alpha-amylase [Lachnospiraceae bacterium]
MKKRMVTLLLAGILAASVLSGCGGSVGSKGLSQMQSVNEAVPTVKLDDKYRSCYEIFVYSFYDSDGDGIGDLKGVDEKLDYVQKLGADEIWLMSICPSPTYHKYDVTDYEAIDPQYGSMEDFKKLVADCHKRGITVITDLVLNHTSSEHPWFQKACDYLKHLPKGKKPDPEKCPYVSYYNFTRDTDKTGSAKLSGTDWAYEARFWEGMPDLNLDQPKVRKEIEAITKYWTDLGVDGFRLDATTSYYTGQNSKNISFMTWLNDTVKKQNPKAYMVGEAWTDSMTYTSFYKSGIDSFFDFDFAGNDGTIAKAVRGNVTAEAFGKAMLQIQDRIAGNQATGIDAPFYTNHDMARSAGYYSQDDKGEKTKFAQGLNLMMSGDAFLYYGEEIGMKGSGIDENKRAPMYWSSNSKAKGMTRGPQGMETFDMKFAPLEKQQKDPYSIYSYVQQALRLRKNFPAIARGEISMDEGCSDEKILVIEKKPKDTSLTPVVLVYNMSDKQQEVDLSKMSFAQKTLSGVLCVNKKEITLSGQTLTMPGRSIAVLTK